jgi:hypothetical protein
MQTTRFSRALFIVASLLLVGATPVSAQTSWHVGIGTGLARMNADGVQGLNAGPFGPVMADVDLSPDDFSDLIDTAIGGGGYVTNGMVMVQFSLAKIKLAGEPSGTLPSGASFDGMWGFDITSGEVTVGYNAYRQGRIAVRPFGGVRFLKHELGVDLNVAKTPVVSAAIDNSWTDVMAGVAVDVGLAPKVGWSSSVSASFGGSNGIYGVRTGVSYTPWKFLTLTPNAFFSAIDVENGVPGDADWYLYDANEFGWGLSFLIHIL